jgi:site-specific DNA-methyltransferase (adenine-specific)
MSAEIIHGDCLDVLRGMPDASVNAVVTSPPYAMQRVAQYGGTPETAYPEWTVAWMRAVRRVLVPDGSVFVNIREHIKDGELSDYVHRTRMALRADGWIECDEIIWHKPGSPPLGHTGRPRRAWERVLWFSPSRRPYCDPKANGQASRRVGGVVNRTNTSQLHGDQAPHQDGISRCEDIVSVSVRCVPNGIEHPAAYPAPLAAWLMRLVTPIGGCVLDPFAGSGSTGVACMQTGRSFIGIEREAAYVEIARKRIADASAQMALGVA